jgi:dolichol-phosphate mannosyltransferase
MSTASAGSGAGSTTGRPAGGSTGIGTLGSTGSSLSLAARVSVVAPVFNERECLPEFHRRVAAVLDGLGRPFEIILVDDGSRDDSWAQIVALSRIDPRVRGVRFTRNFGQHHALSAGLDRARGEWVVLMDCDLQDRPEELPALLEKAVAGSDVVLARRVNRTDGPFKRATSRLFYALLNRLAEIRIDPTTANFGVYHRRVVAALRSFPEHHRFIPGLLSWSGYPTAHVDVEHGTRHAGRTSYDLKRMWRLATGVVLAHSDKPLRMSIHFGFVMAALSLVAVVWLVLRKFLWALPVPGWTSVMVSLFFVGGLLIANMGMVGVYIGRIFEEVKARPMYLARETVGFGPESAGGEADVREDERTRGRAHRSAQ